MYERIGNVNVKSMNSVRISIAIKFLNVELNLQYTAEI